MSKPKPYEASLTKSLKKFNEACNEIALLAMQYPIHPTHVADIQDRTRVRVGELKKQVEQKQMPTEVSLSPIKDEESGYQTNQMS